MSGSMKYIYCLLETNGNTTDSSSFSSLSTSAAVTVASPWVRRVQYLIGYGTTIYISPFCKRNVSLLSLLSSAYHPRLGWSLRYILPLQFDSLFVFDSVDRHVNNSSSSPSIIRARPRSSAFFPFRSRPPPPPPWVPPPPPPPLPRTTTFSDPTATDDGGIIYTAEAEVVAEAEVQAWDDADDDDDN